jgi:hypothetical protein
MVAAPLAAQEQAQAQARREQTVQHQATKKQARSR